MRFIAYAILGIVLVTPESASACHKRRCHDNCQSNCSYTTSSWANPCCNGGSNMNMNYYHGHTATSSQGNANMPKPATGGSVAPMPNPK